MPFSKLGFALLVSLVCCGASATAGARDRASWLLVPGASAGQVRLGTNATTAVQKLGPSSSDDAAMGHDWSYWGQGKHEVDIYFVRGIDDSASHPEMPVEQVRVTSSRFHTANWVHPGSALATVEWLFPCAVSVKHKKGTPYYGNVALLDDVRRGSAFEFVVRGGKLADSAACTAIIIHPSGHGVLQEYASLYQVSPNGGLTKS